MEEGFRVGGDCVSNVLLEIRKSVEIGILTGQAVGKIQKFSNSQADGIPSPFASWGMTCPALRFSGLATDGLSQLNADASMLLPITCSDIVYEIGIRIRCRCRGDIGVGSCQIHRCRYGDHTGLHRDRRPPG